jgi:hypothetical protein
VSAQKRGNKLDAEGKIPSKMTNFPGFWARARPGLEYLSKIWAEKLVLQILLRNSEKFKPSLHFLSNQLKKLSRFLADLVFFNGPELPVGQFSIVKKHFFINTNNFKDFLLQQLKAHGCLDPSKSYL